MRTRNFRPVFVLLIIAAIISCRNQKATPEANETLEQDIQGINRCRAQYMSAWMIGNADSLSNLYTDEAVVLYPNQPAITGKTAIHSYFKSFFAEYAQDTFELVSDEIKIAGEWGFDRGKYKWRGTLRSKGDTISDQGKYLVILQRQGDGSWKVSRDMDNSDRPLTQMGRGVN